MTQLRRSSWRRALGSVATAVACLPVILLGLLLGLLLAASPAAAHATLVGTDPEEGAVLEASPGVATFTFTERVSLPAGAVSVFDAAGAELESSASGSGRTVTVDLPDRLADGTYVVAWRVVSVDGHPVAGSLSFSVGRPSPQVVSRPDAATDDPWVRAGISVSHGAGYVALFLAVGLALFLVVLLADSTRAEVPRRRLRPVVTVASVVAVAAALATLPLTALDQQGLGPGEVARSAAWSGVPGWGWVSFGVLAAGLAALNLGLGRGSGPGRGRPGRRGQVVVALGVTAAVVAPGLTGHTRAFTPDWPMIVTDAMHVLVGSVWVGGLVGLAVALPALAGARGEAERLLSRWSSTAADVLVALLVTGVLLAWRIVGSWEALFQTTYGGVLLAKLALVATAVAIATWNRFRLLPRAVRDDGHAHNVAAAHRLSRVVSVEAGVLVVVLGLTGFLVNQSPVATAQGVAAGRTGVEVTALGEEVEVLGTLSPGRTGRNRLTVQLQDLAGEPYQPRRPPVVSLRSEGLDLGRLALRGDGAGTYVADVVVPDPGEWRVQVSLRLSRFDNPVGVLRFDVAGQAD